MISSCTLSSLVYLNTGAFEEINGEKVRTCEFVFSKKRSNRVNSIFIDLREAENAVEKELQYLYALNNKPSNMVYYANMDSFKIIDGSCFSYWLSEGILNILKSKEKVRNYAETRHGLVTGNGELFMRLWHEVSYQDICYGNENGYKWFPYNKGGSFRRWYGNREYIVNWENNGRQIKNYRDEKGNIKSSNYNEGYNFRENLSWSDIRSGKIAFRYTPKGALFDTSGPAIFIHDPEKLFNLLGFFNTKVMQKLIDVYCTGLHYATGAVEKIPLYDFSSINLKDIVKECIELSKSDWDSFEVSWDFKCHPLVKIAIDINRANSDNVSIEDCYRVWDQECNHRFERIKENEIEINRAFIDIYGLQGELTPEVTDNDVSVRKANLQRDIRALISYAVGCVFGRYSLDHSGLAYAGGEWDTQKYHTFLPDKDNIIPVLDSARFKDDIVERFVEFIGIVFGKNTLEANLQFIADTLGIQGGSPREVIRKYFLNSFFKDHCNTYSVTGSGKRPIYWLFESGDQNGFKALVYMHRWNAETTTRVRALYLHPTQEKYENEVRALEAMIQGSSNNRQKAVWEKQREKLLKQIEEIKEYDEKIEHLSEEKIDIDLDDGVKRNYEKVQTDRNGKKFRILADIK